MAAHKSFLQRVNCYIIAIIIQVSYSLKFQELKELRELRELKELKTNDSP